jgi:hypothetical protein
MPEQLPPAEHIKYSQERLEDMAIPFEWPVLTPAPTYPVPPTVPELQALVQILKANPWAERVRIGNQWFKVSSAGVQLLQNFFTKQ